MADLDDFFAKKDRKKSKGKKFATTEDLAKKLEDTSKKTDVKPKSKSNPEPDEVIQESLNEDEWREFEEEEGQKDYSNLKIGQLTICDDEQNQNIDGENGSDGQSDGEFNSENSEKGPSGPWKKVQGESVPEPAPPAPAKTNLYVSPALRNQSAQGRAGGKLKNRVAPDLSNEEYFPSLGMASTKEILAKKKIDANFEEVKHGGRLQKASDLPSNAPVTVGNRFGSLADN